MTTTSPPSREIATIPASIPEKLDYARSLAVAGLLPTQYRNNPGNVLYAVEYAEALGLRPIHAITSIHVIEGKPSASAEMIAAIVRRAGHRLRVTATDTEARAELVRADDPDFTYVAEWNMAKAQAAKLVKAGGNWEKYPAAMLRSRAITEVVRAGASDAMFGLVYTPEELGATVDATGAVVEHIPGETGPTPPPAPTSGTARLGAALGVEPTPTDPSADDDGVVDAEVVPDDAPPAGDTPEPTDDGEPDGNPPPEPDPAPAAAPPKGPKMTNAQGGRMSAVFMAAGQIRDPAQRLVVIRKILGRADIIGPGDLTKDEAEVVIDNVDQYGGNGDEFRKAMGLPAAES